MIDLSKIPEEKRTYEICLETVRRDDWALKYVPANLRAEAEALL
jgi:hypothetical protein